jgi:hypothetical protein
LEFEESSKWGSKGVPKKFWDLYPTMADTNRDMTSNYNGTIT